MIYLISTLGFLMATIGMLEMRRRHEQVSAPLMIVYTIAACAWIITTTMEIATR